LSSREFPSATSGQALLRSYFLVFLLLLSPLFHSLFSFCMNDCQCFWLEFWVKPCNCSYQPSCAFIRGSGSARRN
jgi:hypothetical protein